MWMLATDIDAQMLEHPFPKLVLRQHSRDCAADHSIRLSLEHLARRDLSQPARIARVPPVKLPIHLLSGQPDFFSIDDYHMVAAEQEGHVTHLTPTREQGGDSSSETSKYVA